MAEEKNQVIGKKISKNLEEAIGKKFNKTLAELEEASKELTQKHDELVKDQEEMTDEFNKDITKGIEELYGTTDVNEIYSVKAMIDRLEAQLYYIEHGEVDPSKEDYINDRIDKYSNAGKVNIDTAKLEDIKEQLKDSLSMEDLINKAKVPMGSVNQGYIRSLNKKINVKLNTKSVREETNRYVNLENIYQTLLMIMKDTTPKTKRYCLLITASIGKYMQHNATDRPYLVSNIGRNIVNVGTFGDHLDQNTLIIENLNKLVQKLDLK